MKIEVTPHITRAQLAAILGTTFTANWIKRHERRLGLHEARVMYVRQPVIYRTKAAIIILADHGFDVSRVRTLMAGQDRE